MKIKYWKDLIGMFLFTKVYMRYLEKVLLQVVVENKKSNQFH